MLPLQAPVLLLQIPGAPELIVLLFVLLLLAVPLVLVVAAVVLYFVFVRDGGEE